MAATVANAAAALAAGAAAMVSPSTERPASSVAVLEGWVMKRSKNFHQWRPRWLTLRENEGPRWSLETSSDLRGSSKSSWDLESLLSTRLVDDSQFGRPHCFLVEFADGPLPSPRPGQEVGGSAIAPAQSSRWNVLGSSGKKKEIYFQASSLEERNSWFSSLTKAQEDAAGAAAKRAAQAKAAAEAAAAAAAAKEEPTEGAAPAEAKAKGKGKGKGPPPPPPKASASEEGSNDKGKGKGKGKTKGKDKDTPEKEALPFGKRITMWGAVKSPEDSADAGEGTVFDGLLEGDSTKDQIKALDSVFKTEGQGQGKAHNAPLKQLIKEFSVARQKGTALLPQRDAQNIAIVLRCMPVHGHELVDVLESLKPGPVEDEHLERLEDILPSQEQFELLRGYSGPEEELRDVEKQLLPMARLQRLPQRLRVLRTAANLEQQREVVAAQLSNIQAACSEMRASRTLRNVFAAVLVMFNYVNYGKTGKEEAHAFDLATLLHLDKFKAGQGPFRSFNGLHFIVTRLLLEDTGVTPDSLMKELGHLQQAMQTSLSEVQASINLLRSEAEFLYAERSKHATAYGAEPPAPPSPPPEPSAAIAAEAEPAPTSFEGLTSVTSVGTSRNLGARRVGKSRGNILKDVRNFLRLQEKTFFHGEGAGGGPEPPPPPDDMPPPAVLLMGNPEQSGSWRPVSVEVATTGVLLLTEPDTIEAEGGGALAQYVVIAGADVVSMDSPLASLEARGEAMEVMMMAAATPANWWGPTRARPPSAPFELQGVCFQGDLHSKKRLWLAAEDPEASKLWMNALSRLAVTAGAGFLWVKDQTFGIWRWRWVSLCSKTTAGDGNVNGRKASEEEERLLVWHRTPGEMLRMEPPIGGASLGSNPTVRTFAASGHSEASRCPHGFSILTAANVEAQLCATTQNDMERWVHALQQLDAPRSPVAAPVREDSKNTEPMEDIFAWIAAGVDEEPRARPSRSSASRGSRNSERRRSSLERPPDQDSDASTATRSSSSTAVSESQLLPLHQLGLLAHRVDASAGQLLQSLDAATADCRRLLAYFRQQQQEASLQLLSQQVHGFFATIRTFAGRLRQAFNEVTQHREACKRKGQPDPFAARGAEVSRCKVGDKDLHHLSLFNFNTPSQAGPGGQGARWHVQLEVKRVAKAAVASLVATANCRLCAQMLVQRAVLNSMGLDSEVPALADCLVVLAQAAAPRHGPGRPDREALKLQQKARQVIKARALFA